MRKLFIISSALCILFLSCEKENDNLTGIYERNYDSDNFTMELKDNLDYNIKCDNYAMDPNYWYGTYKIVGDSIFLNQHEDFMGTNTNISYQYKYKKNALTFIKDTITIAWNKVID